MQAMDFYRRVAERLNIDHQRAKSITLSTLESLRHRLTQEVAEELASQLPRDMEHALNDPEYDELYDEHLFVGPLMNLADTEAYWDQSLGGLDLVSVHNVDDVTRQIQAVFGVIKEYVNKSTAWNVAASLPDGVQKWFIGAPAVAQTHRVQFGHDYPRLVD